MEASEIAENPSKLLICKVFMEVETLRETPPETREKLWTTLRRTRRVRLVHTLSAARPQAPVGKRCDPPDVHSFTQRPEHGPTGPGRGYPQRRCERYRAGGGCAAGERKMLRVARARSTKGGVGRSVPMPADPPARSRSGPGCVRRRRRWFSSARVRRSPRRLRDAARGPPRGSRAGFPRRSWAYRVPAEGSRCSSPRDTLGIKVPRAPARSLREEPS